MHQTHKFWIIYFYTVINTISQLSFKTEDHLKMFSLLSGVQEVATDRWGVHVERVEVKDVRLPQELIIINRFLSKAEINIL